MRMRTSVFVRVIILIVCAVSMQFTLAYKAQTKFDLYENDDSINILTMKPGESIGTQFNCRASFNSVSIDVKRVYPSIESSGVKLSLYKWDTSYAKSMKSDPVASISYPQIRTNTQYELEIEGGMEPGEYLFIYTSLSGSWNTSLFSKPKKDVRFYENGIPVEKAYAVSLQIDGSGQDFLSSISDEKRIANELNVKPDSWYAVDGLGRTLSVSGDVGKKNPNKFVGIFYWTGSGYWSKLTSPRNITQVLASVSEETAKQAKNDYEHELWKSTESPTWFWDEPLFGYYNTNDDFVIRKHAELLADSGVDVIFFDACVGLTTTASYMNVFEVFAKARVQGVDTPDIAFMLPMGDAVACATYLRILYDQIYSKGLYKDLWFYWDDKPLILAYNNNLGTDYTDGEIRDFFTFRKGDAWSWREKDFVSTPENPFWGWMNIYPQPKYYNDGKGKKVEQITVGVAQNVDVVKKVPTAMNGNNVAGRSYTYGDYSYSYKRNGEKVTVNSDIEDSVLYGLNFQQQWDYAIESDPEFIFVTGWNEWTVGRYKDFEGIKNGFPDQYDIEYSRDTEPSAGVLKDHYYYQLVENIRRFKGLEEPAKIKGYKSININGDVNQWNDITSFDHYEGSTWNRKTEGYVGTFYENYTMRNDIIRSKVAYDDSKMYFYVETLNDLTDHTDPSWMRLFIDTDFSGKSNNWEGFEYLINRINPDKNTCVIERSLGISESGEWQWEQVGSVKYIINGNILQIEIPRSMIDMDGNDIAFNFKWSDNMQAQGDVMDFYKNGDVAPGGRFMFHFSASDKWYDRVINQSSLGLFVIAILFVAVAIALFVIAFIVTKKKNKRRMFNAYFRQKKTC